MLCGCGQVSSGSAPEAQSSVPQLEQPLQASAFAGTGWPLPGASCWCACWAGPTVKPDAARTRRGWRAGRGHPRYGLSQVGKGCVCVGNKHGAAAHRDLARAQVGCGWGDAWCMCRARADTRLACFCPLSSGVQHDPVPGAPPWMAASLRLHAASRCAAMGRAQERCAQTQTRASSHLGVRQAQRRRLLACCAAIRDDPGLLHLRSRAPPCARWRHRRASAGGAGGWMRNQWAPACLMRCQRHVTCAGCVPTASPLRHQLTQHVPHPLRRSPLPAE